MGKILRKTQIIEPIKPALPESKEVRFAPKQCWFNTLDSRKANKLQGGTMLGFVAGRKQSESNKWDEYLIDKTDLSTAIIEQLGKL